MKKWISEVLTDRWLLVLMVLSGGMVWLMSYGIGFTVGPDGNDYVGIAYQLFDHRQHGMPTDYVGPFYSAFLKILFGMGGGLWFKWLHHYLPAFFVPLIIYLALKPFHRPAAFMTSLLLTLDVNSMFHFAGICSEAPYMFWLAVSFWTFCRLLQQPQNAWFAYGHGVSLAMLSMTRAAGRVLFVVLLPFYALLFRNKNLLIRFSLAFVLPLLLVYGMIAFVVPTIKFPSAIAPLTFLRTYHMLNPQSENVHRLIDEMERNYFERPLSSQAKALLTKDFLECNWRASNMMFDIAWSPHTKEFDQLINATFWETVKSLDKKQVMSILKTYKKGIYFYSEFTPLPMIYTNIFPYDGVRSRYDSKIGVDGRLKDYESYYGVPIKKELVDYFYKKYCPIDYDQFNHNQLHAWAIRVLGAISIIYPFFVQRWVFLLALVFLFIKGWTFREYRIAAIYGIILFVYNYLLTMLFGPHERYRAVMDMFYFIPTGWLYAYLIFDKNWKSPWKAIGWILLLIMIAVNVHEMSPILRDWCLQTGFNPFRVS